MRLGAALAASAVCSACAACKRRVRQRGLTTAGPSSARRGSLCLRQSSCLPLTHSLTHARQWNISPVNSLPDYEKLTAEDPSLLSKTVMLKLNGGLGTGMGPPARPNVGQTPH